MANVKATADTVKNVAAKKAEETKEAVKTAAKAVETKIDEVKTEAKEAAVKAETKVAAVKAEKAAPEKKEVAPAKEVKADKKKPGRKPGSKTKTTKAAKKEEAVTEVYVQYGPNGEAAVDAVVDRIRNEYVAQGHRASSIKSLKVYVKPEERSAYYVINEKVQGRVDLF
ncbi:MAG: DUF6465 family protein [Lachnospiraceae bacterium]